MRFWLGLFLAFLILVFISDIQKGLEFFFSSPLRHLIAGFAGLTFYGWMSFKKEGKELPYFLKLIFWGINLLFFFTWCTAFFFDLARVTDVLLYICFLMLGIFSVGLAERIYIPMKDSLVNAVTKNSSTERTHRTDVREIDLVLPKAKDNFDPEKYFKTGVFF